MHKMVGKKESALEAIQENGSIIAVTVQEICEKQGCVVLFCFLLISFIGPTIAGEDVSHIQTPQICGMRNDTK